MEPFLSTVTAWRWWRRADDAASPAGRPCSYLVWIGPHIVERTSGDGKRGRPPKTVAPPPAPTPAVSFRVRPRLEALRRLIAQAKAA